MTWFKEQSVTIEDLNSLKDLSKDYGYDLIVDPYGNFSGRCNFESKYIMLGFRYLKDLPLNIGLSVFFHELAHAHNQIHGIYPEYHSDMSRSETIVRKTALEAEIYTDKIGKKLMSIYFPGIKYHAFYTSNDQKYLDHYYGWAS